MSALSAAKAILEADVTLLAAATGGIFDFDETGRLGLSRTTTPTAFDATGIIKPCVLLKLRSSTPDFQLADDPTQYVSVREMLEAWFFSDNSYAAIETMRNRTYILLHGKQLAGTFVVRWAGDVRIPIRDMDLDSFVERSDYLAIVKRSA
jgi:hypothetical protein